MAMTITEKILAAHAGREQVQAGELINVRVDLVLGNDITAPVAIKEFRKIGVERVFDPERIALVPDHFTPNKDIKSAEQAKLVREFAREQGLTNYFEVGRMGIEHCLLPEQGLVGPGDVVIGADSHTCTYGALGAFSTGVGSTDLAAAMALGEIWFRVPETIKFVYHGQLRPWVSGKDLILHTIGLIGVDGARYMAMEFTGEAIENLSMDGRFTMCNMAIEAGAKNGIIAPDQKTLEYVQGRTKRPWQVYQSDPDARYYKVIDIDAAAIEPTVAFPHLPENTRPISQVGTVEIDQVVIGSCTNGRIEDLRIAARILEGKKVHPRVRCIVIPGTQAIYQQAMAEGLIKTFIEAECAVSTPTCGPCLGGHMGILAKGERALATTNRNFVGRMGHPESEVYLASPAVAAASAIAGQIVAPEEVL
ncbi:3-isopropylmalate dehydratase, large subunit [Carboxydocella sporoproducens DSM 16521]|uniref:3-isopropylmalate dehydratase large subunit n=2 Tax=Carboxydocella TaxID=178898 RepID=A0A1T4L7S8_9FIRM|nr:MULTISPECIES: 3-isopropylmalate dehydratase large subunit [Carboxydocella]AVX19924.1 3-isopropylmalate dehydratase, large subunit [Carboxydocella thermautotrophica]SJZ50703.1 3-isopropylmalate dehydratase, large subunit [Carboxydocella sporoproducens DSM 16521]